MKTPLLLLICLAACGRQLRVSSVDTEARAYFDDITRNLAALGYPDLVVEGPGGVAIEVASRSRAYHTPSRIVIPRTDSAEMRLMLAHEIGHALGLAHAPSGLMMAEGFPEYCYGSNAAVCLIEALQ